MQAHVDTDESFPITVKTVLGMAQRAKDIFESSNMDEKQ